MRFAILFGALILSGCGMGNGSEGVHRGVITDVSKAGWIFKAWEGEMLSGAGQASIHYRFTIEGEDTVKKMLAAQSSGKQVIVKYYSPAIYSLAQSSYPNFVKDVEVDQEIKQ